MQHLIRYGTTSNSLVHLPPETVASATYRIEDLLEDPDAAGRLLASGSATPDSTSTTTDAVCGATQPDARLIPVAATAGITVGGIYYLQDASGYGEIVKVEGIESGVSVTAESDMLYDYASGSTFRGLAISAAFPDGEVTEERTVGRWPMRVVWAYTVRGKAYRIQETIQIVRDTATEGGDADVLRQLQALVPDLVRRASSDGRRIESIVAGCREEISNMLRARGLDPERTLLGDIGRDLVVWHVCHFLSAIGLAPGSREPADWERDSRKRLEHYWAMVNTGVRGAAMDLNIEHQTGRVSNRQRSIIGRM